MISTGKQFFPHMWDRMCECISEILTASLPTELLTWKPPKHLYRTQSDDSLASSLSSMSEAPLPVKPMSVASVESSVLDTPVGVEEGKDIVTEGPVAPEITVVPSSPHRSKETEDIQINAKVDDITSTNVTENVQDKAKNTSPEDASTNPTSYTLNNVMGDALDNISNNVLGDVLSDKTAITEAASYVQKQEDTVVEGRVEDPPPPNKETDHHVSHDTPQHYVFTSSGKPPFTKKPQQKERKQRKGLFLQRWKKNSSSSTSEKKRKSNVAINAIEPGNKKQRMVKKHNHKLSHLQSPDADLAKSTFNKIGELLW